MLKSAEWKNEVSSRSSAPVTSRSSQTSLALDLPSQTKRYGPFSPSQVLCCVVPEMWDTDGSLEL